MLVVVVFVGAVAEGVRSLEAERATSRRTLRPALGVRVCVCVVGVFVCCGEQMRCTRGFVAAKLHFAHSVSVSLSLSLSLLCLSALSLSLSLLC